MAYNAKSQAKYDKKCVFATAKLFPITDRDIIEYLESSREPKATIIKRAIRAEMAKKASADAIKE